MGNIYVKPLSLFVLFFGVFYFLKYIRSIAQVIF